MYARTLGILAFAAATMWVLVGCGSEDGVGLSPDPTSPPSFVLNSTQAETLISYWKFDDGTGPTAADAVGNHHGELINGPTWTTGQVGGALHFDGVDDYVDAGFGYADMGRLLTWTLEAWVRWEGGDGWYYTILAKPAGRGLPGYEYGFGFQLNTRGSPSPDQAQLWGWANRDAYWPWAKSAQSVSTGTWTHMAVTCEYLSYKVRDFHLYIDGEEVPMGDSNVGLTILGIPKIYIGAGFTSGLISGENYFAGAIDEVAIHGSVLPPEEIRRHYENGLRGIGYEDVLLVDIDIKPGSNPNSVQCNNDAGVITVAILTTDDFDAAGVDHTTVSFEGATETHVDKKTGDPHRHMEDVDKDGDMDLVFHFRMGDTSLDCLSTQGTLTGVTYDGTAVEGTDVVWMIEGG